MQDIIAGYMLALSNPCSLSPFFESNVSRQDSGYLMSQDDMVGAEFARQMLIPRLGTTRSRGDDRRLASVSFPK